MCFLDWDTTQDTSEGMIREFSEEQRGLEQGQFVLKTGGAGDGIRTHDILLGN